MLSGYAGDVPRRRLVVNNIAPGDSNGA